MNVYQTTEDGIELAGSTSLTAEQGGEYVVDIAIPGTGAALRLTYELKAVPYLADDLTIGMERAVVLALGQTPDFLPGWTRRDGNDEAEGLIWPGLPHRPDSSPQGPARPLRG